MSNEAAQKTAQVVMAITEAAVRMATHDAGNGAALCLGAIAGPLYLAAGLQSADFADKPLTRHPASCGTADNLLFTCLLAARALDRSTEAGTDDAGINLAISPAVLLAVIDDFKKLSATPVESFLRADMLKAVNDAHAGAVGVVDDLMARLSPGHSTLQ